MRRVGLGFSLCLSLCLSLWLSLGLSLSLAATAGAATPNLIPTSSDVHDWTDSTGRFHTQAILLGGDCSQVRLQKIHGSVITVPVTRLCDQDQKFVLHSLRLPPLAVDDRGDRPVATKDRDPIVAPNAAEPGANGPSADSPDWLSDLKSGWSGLAIPSVGDTGAMAAAGRLIAGPAPPMPENMIYIRLSQPVLEQVLDEQVSRRERISDVVLGSQVGGTSQTTGSTRFELQPSDTTGLAVIYLFGSTTYNSVADAGPIQVFTSGVTRFAAAKGMRIDGQGIQFGPAVTNAQTSSTVTDVRTSLPRLRGRIALRIGSRRAAESRGEAAAITAQHTAQRIDRQFDLAASEKVVDLWRTLGDQFAALPADHPLRRCSWQVSSTSDALQIVVFAPRTDKFRPVPAPAAALADAEIEVQIHVAMVRYAMTNGALQQLLRPVSVRLASMRGAANGSSAFGKPTLRWSSDHDWLSLSWSKTTAPPHAPTSPSPTSPSPQVAAR